MAMEDRYKTRQATISGFTVIMIGVILTHTPNLDHAKWYGIACAFIGATRMFIGLVFGE